MNEIYVTISKEPGRFAFTIELQTLQTCHCMREIVGLPSWKLLVDAPCSAWEPHATVLFAYTVCLKKHPRHF